MIRNLLIFDGIKGCGFPIFHPVPLVLVVVVRVTPPSGGVFFECVYKNMEFVWLLNLKPINAYLYATSLRIYDMAKRFLHADEGHYSKKGKYCTVAKAENQ